MSAWHIITGEYPPQPGGVSDYTRQVARGLAAAGDPVVVWAPGIADGGEVRDPGVEVKRLPDRFGPRSLRMLSDGLDRARQPHRVLVQYVPHAFGWKAANVPFCVWLRGRRRDRVWVMFHEVSFPLDARAGLARNGLALVNRVMARLVGRAAERAFVSIPAWQAGVGAVTPSGTPVTWLPVPSGIPVVDDRRASRAIGDRYGRGQPLVGHFGTYGGLIRPLLFQGLTQLLKLCDCRVLLLGRGSDAARRDAMAVDPALEDRLHATGALPAEELSRHIRACDVMLQPYPDGISSRRTSAMVVLSHAMPMVTTTGPLTEPLWAERDAALLVPAGDPAGLAAAAASLVADPSKRAAVASRAAAIYDERFDLRHTITALRSCA